MTAPITRWERSSSLASSQCIDRTFRKARQTALSCARGLALGTGARRRAPPHGSLIALPIPFGNVVPGLAVLLIALGLARHDGLMIVAGLAMSIAALTTSVLLVYGSVWAGGARAAGELTDAPDAATLDALTRAALAQIDNIRAKC
jgi:Exopolysaccharide synthesis, ExoD